MRIRVEVPVEARTDEYGEEIPISFRWINGDDYTVDQIYRSDTKANPAGGFGRCFDVRASCDGAEIYDRRGLLWFDIPTGGWYINRDMGSDGTVCGSFRMAKEQGNLLRDWNNREQSWLPPDMVEQLVAEGELLPADYYPGILLENGEEKAKIMQWGIAKPWAQSPIINARSEAVDTAIAFRAIAANRCLIPAEAFYMWQLEGKAASRKYAFTLLNQAQLGLAALYEEEGEKGKCRFILLTTAANRWAASVRDRMPLILSQEEAEAWLNPKNEISSFRDRSKVEITKIPV